MKRLFRTVLFIVVTYMLLSGVIDAFMNREQSIDQCEDRFATINKNNDRKHERNWQTSSYGDSFCASYNSKESISQSMGEQRNSIYSEIDNYENFWGSVYQELVKDSNPHLNVLIDSLKILSKKNGLDNAEFAEMVVSFVQDIPYSYVRSEACTDADNKGKPCVGNMALGILSPYEFLHTLYGDCDTRAVLIYAILEKCGYDPMIVISNEYAHAMLALNIPSAGDHLKHRGKNYYFWETTGKGWPIGMLPPNSNNVDYWKVALVNDK